MNRKHLVKHSIAAALVAAFGVAAVAQPAPAGAPQGQNAPAAPMGQRMERHHGKFDPARMQERRAQRQAALKQKLQITPAQEGAWSAFTAAMQPPANLKRPDRAEWEKLTTPERIDRMKALRAERNAMADKRADATKTFYAQLSPEQKKTFDSQRFAGGRGGRHHHHHHHG